MYAGYVDGFWPSYSGIVGRFPKALVVPIATSYRTNAGLVLDVEDGDATAAQAVTWTTMRRKAGVNPTIYCGENPQTWADVKAAFANAGVAQPQYWVANYTTEADVVPAGAVAHQYTDTGPYDISAVLDYWPGVDPVPVAPTELNMNATDPSSGGFWVYFPSDGHIESYGGAPYLGAPNNHTGTWTLEGTVSGFCAKNDPSTGGWGCNITTTLSVPNSAGEWCNNYFFPRNGSLKPS